MERLRASPESLAFNAAIVAGLCGRAQACFVQTSTGLGSTECYCSSCLPWRLVAFTTAIYVGVKIGRSDRLPSLA